MIIAANILTAAGDFWSVQECAKVLDVLKDDAERLLEVYPACTSLIEQSNLAAVTPAHVNMEGTAVEVMAALNESFGMSGWVAFVLHAIGVEVYVCARLCERALLVQPNQMLTPIHHSCNSHHKSPAALGRSATSGKPKPATNIQATQASWLGKVLSM